MSDTDTSFDCADPEILDLLHTYKREHQEQRDAESRGDQVAATRHYQAAVRALKEVRRLVYGG